MASTRTVPRRPGPRSRGLAAGPTPAPATTVLARPSTHLRDAALLVAAGLGGYGAAPLMGYPGLDAPALLAGFGGGALVAVAGERGRRRRELEDRVLEALAPLLGVRHLDRRIVTLSRWTRGWPGRPTRVRVRYAPGVMDTDPAWKGEIVAVLASRLLAAYEVTRHDRRGCTLWLKLVTTEPDSAPAPPAQVRAERVITELIGPTTAFTGVELTDGELRSVSVSHQAGARLAAAGYRNRIERVISTMMPGRWRAVWDLEGDSVRFEVRPSLPTSVWLPVRELEDTDDLLRNYRQVRIPCAVDEDGREVLWYPARTPHAMLTGGTGTGKALALTTPIPTPTGWTTMGQLVVGDVVFDEQGQRCTVTGVFDQPPGRPCNEVVFSDGSILVADDDHQWWTVDRAARRSSFRAADPRRRTPRVPQPVVAALELAVARFEKDDLISLADVRDLAGPALTPDVLRGLATEVGWCDSRRVRVVQRYPQTELYPARALLTELVRYAVARPGSMMALAAPRWRQALAAALPDLISLDDVAELAGVTSRTHPSYKYLRRVARALPVPPTPVPGATKVVTRTIGRELLYPARELLTSVLAAGTQSRSDQRYLRTGGRVRTTREIAQTLLAPGGQRNHSVPVTRPLDLPEADLLVPPYVLGAWLGDGTTTMAAITTADAEMLDLLAAEGVIARPTPDPIVYRLRWAAAPVFAERSSEGGSRAVVCAQCGTALKAGESTDTCAGCRRVAQHFHSALRRLGVLGNKHIPPGYLRGSIEQRRALLAGLLDTDGTVSPQGSTQFDNTNEQLARDVLELALSLGHRATLITKTARLNGRDCGPVYRVSFTCAQSPFRLSRKATTHQERCGSVTPSRITQRYITEVRPIGSVPVRCITVDSPSHLFLAGRQFIPTHNTSMAHALLGQITRYGWPVWVLDAKRVEFLDFRTWPNVQVVAGGIPQQVALVRRAWELMEYRYQLIEDGKATVEDFEPLVVFLDEFAEFRSNLVEWYAQIKVKGDPTRPPTLAEVASLARKARTARIHLVLSTQRPDVEFLGGEMRDNFGFRMSMGRLSPQGAMMMWENPAVGVSLPRACTGRATATHEDGRPVEVQCYRFPDVHAPASSGEHQLLEEIRPLEARWPRLVIVPPGSQDDLDGREPTPPTFREYARAEWDLAENRPDLDPLAHPGGADRDGRELSSTLASLGLTPAGGGRRSPAAVAVPGERPTLRLVEPTWDEAEDPVVAGGGFDADEYLGYAPPIASYARDLAVGDLIEVEEGSGVWVVVDEPPEEDVVAPGMIAVSWRGDGDESGYLSLPDDLQRPVRRPEEDAS